MNKIRNSSVADAWQKNPGGNSAFQGPVNYKKLLAVRGRDHGPWRALFFRTVMGPERHCFRFHDKN